MLLKLAFYVYENGRRGEERALKRDREMVKEGREKSISVYIDSVAVSVSDSDLDLDLNSQSALIAAICNRIYGSRLAHVLAINRHQQQQL